MAAPMENFAESNVPEVVTENLLDQNQEHEGAAEVAVVEKKWPGWPGENVFRIIFPALKVGGLIGRKGEFIKKMCQETRAYIRVLDTPPVVPERAVLISAKEEPDAALSPAMDGLLKVHKYLHGIDAESADMVPSSNNVETRLLVPAAQAGSLIGKQGSTIKSIQECSTASIRIRDELPPFALPDDRMVSIQGEPTAVHKAVELISVHLRKFLVDKSVIPIFESHMSLSHPPMQQSLVPPQSWGHNPGLPPNGGGSSYGSNPLGYGNNPQFIPPRPHDNFYPPPDVSIEKQAHHGIIPPRPHDNFYPPPDVKIEKQAHHGISTYGHEAPLGVNSSAIQPPPQFSQVTQHMQVPLSYADAVIGSSGANISYIRRASGATITIQETRGVPGEMTVEITGSATQVQTAQQLIQNYMAEAAGPTASGPVQNTMPSMDHGYNSYQHQHGSMYGSPAKSAPGYSGGGYAGGYGSYGGAYGY